MWVDLKTRPHKVNTRQAWLRRGNYFVEDAVVNATTKHWHVPTNAATFDRP